MRQSKHGRLGATVEAGPKAVGWRRTEWAGYAGVFVLALRLAKAINVSIALHVFLSGAFMYLWGRYRGLHGLACFMASAIWMFCGPQFFHIHAGHLTNLCCLAWVPLVFLAVDGLLDRPSLRWCLLGVFSLSMQILAGHPQYCYYTLLALLAYCAISLGRVRRRGAFLFWVAVTLVGAIGITAAQLFTAYGEAQESIRSVPLPYEFAAQGSLPPENLLTLLIPGLLGDLTQCPYWGRLLWWEVSLACSAGTLGLAVYGAIQTDRASRRLWLGMVLLFILLALGDHTPLYRILFDWFPFFSKFRCSAKFGFVVALALSMLAGSGLDSLMRCKPASRKFALSLLVMSLVLGLMGVCLSPGLFPSVMGLWNKVFAAILHSQSAGLPEAFYSQPDSLHRAAASSGRSILLAAAMYVAVALAAGLVRWSRRWVAAVALLAVAEVFFIARGSMQTFNLAQTEGNEAKAFLEQHPGDYRILNLVLPNQAMRWGRDVTWGEDPGVPLRYAQFIASTQGEDPDKASQAVVFKNPHPAFRMLRCRFAFSLSGNQVNISELPNVLPRFKVLQKCRVLSRRSDIFAALGSPSFDPGQEVLLEKATPPLPTLSESAGSVRLLGTPSTDEFTLGATVGAPSLLLITDGFSTGWRAEAVSGSSQAHYEIVPANYCLQAVPLRPGYHRIHFKYLPKGFVAGKWISFISVGGFLFIVVTHVRRQEGEGAS